MDFDYYCS